MTKRNHHLTIFFPDGRTYTFPDEDVMRMKQELNIERKKLKNSGRCMACDLSDCEGPIIRSHTISRCWQQNLADNKNKILSVRRNNFATYPDPYLYLDSHGINKASTYPIFCKKHDNDLFKEIEDFDFNATPRQVCLLFLRTIAKELFLLKNSLDELRFLFNLFWNKYGIKGYLPSLQLQQYHSETAVYERGKNIIQRIKKCLMNDSYNEFSFLRIPLNDTPPIASISCMTPFCDLGGNLCVTHTDLLLGIIPIKKGGWIIVAYPNKINKIEAQFAFSILSQKNILASAMWAAFTMSDNIACNSDWHKKLPDSVKEIITNSLMGYSYDSNHMMKNPITEYIQDYSGKHEWVNTACSMED